MLVKDLDIEHGALIFLNFSLGRLVVVLEKEWISKAGLLVRVLMATLRRYRVDEIQDAAGNWDLFKIFSQVADQIFLKLRIKSFK